MKVRFLVTASDSPPFEWRYSGTSCTIGRDPACSLAFEDYAGDVISRRHAELAIGADGVRLVDLNSTNGVYLNGQRMEKSTLLREHDVFQLGQSGPTFKFIDLEPAGHGEKPASGPAKSEKMNRPQQSGRPNQAVPHRPQPDSDVPSNAPVWYIGGAVGLVAIVAIYMMAQSMPRRPVDPTEGDQVVHAKENPGTPEPAKKQEPKPEPEPTKPPGTQGGTSTPSPIPPQPKPADQSPWRTALDRISPALWLLVVEEPKRSDSWVFASGVAVGDHHVLTSASVANELAKFRAKGWKLWLQRPNDKNRIALSEDVREHVGYRKAETGQRSYFDLALIRQAEKLPAKVSLVQTNTPVEKGMPVACAYIQHSGEPITKFDPLEAKADAATIFNITTLPPKGGPRMLYLSGQASELASGGPVIDDQGRLLGIFLEPASNDKNSEEKSKSTAVMFDPWMLTAADAKIGAEASVWVPVAAPAEPPNSQGTSQ